jgi:fructose-1,6-bisphosphatase
MDIDKKGNTMEEYATRDEIKALEVRVGSLSESCIQCRTALNSDVRHLTEGLAETKRDVTEIKSMVSKISEQIQSLTIKVSIIVAIIVGVINFVVPLLKLGAK